LNGLQPFQSGGIGTVSSNWTVARPATSMMATASATCSGATLLAGRLRLLLNGRQASGSAGVGIVGLDWTTQGLNAD
jgi:hypothetical protein